MVSLSCPNDLEDTLPSPVCLLEAVATNSFLRSFISKSRQTVANILNGSDPRVLLVVGPCSIHDRKSSIEYAKRLKELAALVSDHFYIVMRAYFEKPRTVYGWKGFLYDPSLDGSHDISMGLYLARQLLIELTELEIPVATELLEIITAPYLTDLITWGCVGARTSNSPPHRQLAATLPFPIGFKNTTCGNILNAVNGCLSASSPHAFMGINQEGELGRIFGSGNPHCHVILRGGEKGPNYDLSSIKSTLLMLRSRTLPERVIVDCSHDNSQKIPMQQIPVFNSLISEIARGNRAIKGIMLESHLFEGRQHITKNVDKLKYGISVTDPCMGFDSTERVILEGYAKLQANLLVTV